MGFRVLGFIFLFILSSCSRTSFLQLRSLVPSHTPIQFNLELVSDPLIQPTPQFKVSQLEIGDQITLYRGADAECHGGDVVGSTGVTASDMNPQIEAQEKDRLITASQFFRIKVTKPNGESACSSEIKYELPVPTSTPVVNGAIQVVSGTDYSCALLEDKTVKCWGKNDTGQLGDGTGLNQTTPVQVVGLTDVVAIAAGHMHACALMQDKTMRCWGSGFAGQLGNGSNGASFTPVPVSILNNVKQMAIGYSFTCALLDDDTVSCWGNNSFGQLGDGTGNFRNTPVAVVGLAGPVTKIGTGNYHTCAVLIDKTLQCWGHNIFGQVGDGTTTARYNPVAVLGVSNVKELTLVGNYSCALLETGTETCWTTTTYPVSGLTGIVQTSAGLSQACALMSDKTVQCWFAGSGSASAVSGIDNAVQVTGGGNHMCALLDDKRIKCFGDNSFGQLGHNHGTGPVFSPYGNFSTSYNVSFIDTANQVEAGPGFSCATLKDKTIKCWGLNNTGQLGDGNTGYNYTPVAVLGVNDAVKVVAGSYHSCALMSDKTVRCWGANWSGQLGDGSLNSSNTQITVNGLNNVTQLAVGTYHSCALLEDKTVMCWGGNGSDQLGDATGVDQLSPQLVPGLSNVIQIAARGYSSCALLSDKTVKCWGSNSSGQLGVGVVSSYSAGPAAVVGLTNVTQVVMGNNHACAVLENKTMKCWGSNWAYQLGDGTTTNTLAPGAAVIGLNSVIQVAIGDYNTCGLLEDKTIKCWGYNGSGQLGDGTTVNQSSPVSVLGINNATQVSSGASHVCAGLADKTVKCWGSNNSGEMGILFKIPPPVLSTVEF